MITAITTIVAAETAAESVVGLGAVLAESTGAGAELATSAVVLGLLAQFTVGAILGALGCLSVSALHSRAGRASAGAVLRRITRSVRGAGSGGQPRTAAPTTPAAPAAAAGGQWWEIVSPPVLPADAAVAMWRTVAGVIGRDDRAYRDRPGARLRALVAVVWPWTPVRWPAAVEWWADDRGLRAGVWLAEGAPAAALAEGLRAAWPGAEITKATTPPTLTGPGEPLGSGGSGWGRAAAVLDLVPDAGGLWAPLIDPATRPDRPTTGAAAGAEGLRAVLARLTALGPGDRACVQLVIGPAPDPRPGLGGYHGDGLTAAVRAVAPALLGSATGAVAWLVVELLDLFTPARRSTLRRLTTRPARPTTGRVRGGDPVAEARHGERMAKRLAGPHLRVSLRVAATTPAPRSNTTAADLAGDPGEPGQRARRTAANLAAGFDLVTTHARLHPHPAPDPAALDARRPGRAFAATLAELAALWHLPADPTRHGLPAPVAGQARPEPAAARLPAAAPIRARRP